MHLSSLSRSRSLATPLVALVALVLVGCPDSGPDTSTPEGACQALSNALLGYVDRCLPYAESNDRDDLAQIEASCRFVSGLPGTALSTDDVSSCAGKVDGLACGQSFEDQCAFEGKLAPGAACLESSQCANGRCIVPSANATTTACGTCTAYLGQGAACGPDSGDCGPNLECRDGTCAAEPADAKAGEVCFSAKTRPVTARSCEAGAYCDVPEPITADTEARCAPVLADGAACTSSQPCALSSGCVEGTCRAPGGVGARCTDERSCGRDTVCGEGGTCIAVTTVGEGERCDAVRVCRGGTCNGGPGAEPGEAGTCKLDLAIGAACTVGSSSATCKLPGRCLNGTCTVPDMAACK